MLLAVHGLREEICHENVGRKLQHKLARTAQAFHVPFVMVRHVCLGRRHVVSLNMKIWRIRLRGCECHKRLLSVSQRSF